MEKIKDFKIVLCVNDYGIAIILKCPPDSQFRTDLNFCEDNLFENIPKEIGVYECTVEHWTKSCTEGIKNGDIEYDSIFKIVESNCLLDLDCVKV